MRGSLKLDPKVFSTEFWSAARVRQEFIDFFEKKKHTFVPSSSVVPHNDKTLLFTNAGMVPFKDLFLGKVAPGSSMADLKRATNSQKCIRAGGKHNDLDDVGLDVYHHTFFEMLGNWSFGDYFKEVAIDLAFEFYKDVLGLPVDRLYVTYFQGNDTVEPDLDAKKFWMKYLPENRILACDAKDNFWEMGDTGPCGPCSELHFDKIGDRDAAHLVNADVPDVIEIWNLVFMQYNREADGSLRELPDKHVDTGMGFERIVSIMQNVSSNYDTDVFAPIFAAIQTHSGCRDYTGLVGDEDVDKVDMSYRVLADHIRTMSVAIADGCAPDSDGRGYVIRRILRRASRYAFEYLGVKKPGFLPKLVPSVMESLGSFFGGLVEKADVVTKILENEEKVFYDTLGRGTEHFDKIVKSLKKKDESKVPGNEVFFLYDTLGFPTDLTERMAEESSLEVDMDGFNVLMTAARERSKQAGAKKMGDGVNLVLEAEEVSKLRNDDVAHTDDSDKYFWDIKPSATIKAMFTGGRESFIEDTSELEDGTVIGVILDKTPFYATAGGQVTDEGSLNLASGDADLSISDVSTYGGYVVHGGRVTGTMKVGDVVECNVDYERRRKIAPNHTFTHVLNLCLREVCGEGLDQRGSLVDAEKLRFDFSCSEPLSDAVLKKVSDRCNDFVENSQVVYTEVAREKEAKKIEGLRHMFGETYPTNVRVVSVGHPVSDMLADPANEKWKAYAVEFCGGTHLAQTGDAEAFVIVEETSIATGIRRMVCYTKDAARSAEKNGEDLEARLAELENVSDMAILRPRFKSFRELVPTTEVPLLTKRALLKRMDSLNKKIVAADKKEAKKLGAQCTEMVKKRIAEAQEKHESVLVAHLPLFGQQKDMAKVLQAAMKGIDNFACMAVSATSDEKSVALVARSTRSDLPANKWSSDVALTMNGKGGGSAEVGNAKVPISSVADVDELIASAMNTLSV